MQVGYQTASSSLNIFPPSETINVTDRAHSLRKSMSTQQNLASRCEKVTLSHRKEDHRPSSGSYHDTSTCHTQAITSPCEAYSTKYMVNIDENDDPLRSRSKHFSSSGMASKHNNRPYGTPLEPIIEHEKSHSTLRASISTASSVRKIVMRRTSISASIMQGNEKIAMSAISCVPNSRKRARGTDAADEVARQPATRQGHATGGREDHAFQTAQTAAVGAIAPGETAAVPKENRGSPLERCAGDRQNYKPFLASDDRAKSANCKHPVRYRLCPPPENHNFVRDQLTALLKQHGSRLQPNDGSNPIVGLREHTSTKTEKTTILKAIRKQKRQKDIHQKHKLAKNRKNPTYSAVIKLLC